MRAYDQPGGGGYLERKINENFIHRPVKMPEALQEAVRKVTELEAALEKMPNQEPKL